MILGCVVLRALLIMKLLFLSCTMIILDVQCCCLHCFVCNGQLLHSNSLGVGSWVHWSTMQREAMFADQLLHAHRRMLSTCAFCHPSLGDLGSTYRHSFGDLWVEPSSDVVCMCSSCCIFLCFLSMACCPVTVGDTSVPPANAMCI